MDTSRAPDTSGKANGQPPATAIEGRPDIMSLKEILNNDNANWSFLEDNRQSCGIRKMAQVGRGTEEPYEACNGNGNVGIFLPCDEQEQDRLDFLHKVISSH